MFTNTVYLCLGFSVIFFLIGLFFADELILLLGADETIFDMAYTYLQTMILFSPAFIFNDLFLCFIRNDGNPQLSSAATVTRPGLITSSRSCSFSSSAPIRANTSADAAAHTMSSPLGA